MSKIKEDKKEENKQAEAKQAENKQAETKDAKQAENNKSGKNDCKEADKVKELEEKLAKAEEAAKKEKDDYIRLMAEFETFRRRNAEDRLDLVKNASADIIKGLLPVLDDCESAFRALNLDPEKDLEQGPVIIYNKLLTYLKTKGLEPIKARGEVFDTDFHEAVTQFPAPSEDLKGKIIDVAQTGYLLNGKVLRFAKVIVGA